MEYAWNDSGQGALLRRGHGLGRRLGRLGRLVAWLLGCLGRARRSVGASVPPISATRPSATASCALCTANPRSFTRPVLISSSSSSFSLSPPSSAF